MAEFTKEQLLERVNTNHSAEGNARVRALTERIVTDLFHTIDELDVTADEFWKAIAWLTRMGQTGQFGLLTAGLGFDRLLDIRQDEADQKAGRAGGTPRAIEGPLFVAGAPLSQHEVRLDEGEPEG
ncbi:dioxygenase, partial [Acidovorax sp. SRB_24]|uniref:dioxygenase n=1 Tax=Acidovorax sp. SRB_24 TaxID=1962700 RepID=UPI001ED4E8AA